MSKKIHFSWSQAIVFGLVDVLCTQTAKDFCNTTENKYKVTCKKCKKLIGNAIGDKNESKYRNKYKQYRSKTSTK